MSNLQYTHKCYQCDKNTTDMGGGVYLCMWCGKEQPIRTVMEEAELQYIENLLHAPKPPSKDEEML